MPRDVTRMEIVDILTREDNPNQVREFNYIVEFDVMDTETGEMIMEGEYRTLASDRELTEEEIISEMTELVETEKT